MDEWGDGVPMLRSGEDPTVWSITLQLPFTFNDFCVYGMFQFRYQIGFGPDGSDGVYSEGSGERTEQRLKNHFYHTFRPDYRNTRFRNTQMMGPKAVIQAFLRCEVEQLKSGSIDLPEALSRFSDLCECNSGAARGHVEEVFEEEIELVDRTVSTIV
jgi:hypothetical protein